MRGDMAALDDPIEYGGNRRRDFWRVMEARALRGDPYAASVILSRRPRKGHSSEGRRREARLRS